jgi:hypothetical protein
VNFIDPGVAARLLRLSPDKLARRDPTVLTQFGHLLETFVVSEILAQATWTEQIVSVGHWRTRDGIEVDLVLETDDGRVVAFEIKSASRVGGEDLSGLRKLRDVLGPVSPRVSRCTPEPGATPTRIASTSCPWTASGTRDHTPRGRSSLHNHGSAAGGRQSRFTWIGCVVICWLV